ncbi:MAG: hypothetical protein CVV14_03625 [Gammaproteobacteria bacterium HGW-Gammaproteobacteria-4]|jgi:peptidoglycan/xylan/chitin deacetylase (PgdA/CDA1 family)|nr:MAG: hypothetical protein CVV14_03625 [Gammaproteobacteria bacterium HGW-Gammaproteobacteria-4]
MIAMRSADVEPAPVVRARPTVALMYHALSGVDARGQDPHYTLSEAAFREHLEQIASHSGGGTSARDWLVSNSGVGAVITFDDGHLSNHRAALPALCEFGMRADFFVNPATVGRPGFVDWADLREMSASGMSIQSHGYDHRFLTDLSTRHLREALYAARLEIEDRVGTPVSLLAPPGGRVPRNLESIAQECGYSRVFASHPGRLRAGETRTILPRLAVTATCDSATISRWLNGKRSALLRLQLRYHALAAAKRAFGNALYERTRARMLSDHGGTSE